MASKAQIEGLLRKLIAVLPTTDFGLLDVKDVIASSEGENDGANWLALVKLRDGRYAFLSAGCDYTGWDCQAGGSASVAKKKTDLIRFGLTLNDRERLGLLLPDDTRF